MANNRFKRTAGNLGNFDQCSLPAAAYPYGWPYQFGKIMIVFIFLCVIISIILIWIVPKIQIKSLDSTHDPIKKHELENELRKTIVQLTGGFSLTISLLFTWHQLAQTKDKDIAEQINKTISLLGNEKEYVRIGAIYSMEQLAINHEESNPIITSILASYIRNNYQWNKGTNLPENKNEVVHAALRVIAESFQQRPDQKIDLSKTDLRKVIFQNKELSGCTFIDTHFEEADLLSSAFKESNLIGSVFDGANLEKTSFVGANLSHAKFRGTIFVKTDFSGSNLSNAEGLNRSDIESGKIIINKATTLPENLK